MLTYLHTSRLQEFSQYGDLLVGGKIRSYELGTTSNKATYKDIYGLIPNTNPVILDAAGSADMYLFGSYTLALYDVNDVLLATTDLRGSSDDIIESGIIGTWAQNSIIVVENYSAVRAINSPYAWVFVQGREHNEIGRASCRERV